MKTYLMICVSFFTHVIVESGSGVEKNDEEFQIEYVENFKGMVMGSWSQWDRKEFTFGEKELDDFCARAQKYATLDGSKTGAESYTPFYNAHQFASVHFKRLPHIKCRTIPPSYVRLAGVSSMKNTVVMQTNKFISGSPSKFQFHLGKIKSKPILCAEPLKNDEQKENEKLIRSSCSENSRLQENYFYQLAGTDRLLLCYAAKEAVRRLNPNGHHVPVLLNENVEKAQIFDVQFAHIGIQKYILLLCPTSPDMYVGQHVRRTVRSSSVVQVLLVTHNVDSIEQ